MQLCGSQVSRWKTARSQSKVWDTLLLVVNMCVSEFLFYFTNCQKWNNLWKTASNPSGAFLWENAADKQPTRVQPLANSLPLRRKARPRCVFHWPSGRRSLLTCTGLESKSLRLGQKRKTKQKGKDWSCTPLERVCVLLAVGQQKCSEPQL